MSVALAAGVSATVSTAAGAAPASFFTYTGSRPLAQLSPGTVLKTRDLQYSVSGIALPLQVTQVLYRTTDARGRAVANATSVLKTPVSATTGKVVSYQSFYDSLNPADSPSRTIAGGSSSGGMSVHVESALISPFLLQGYDVVVTDTEGPRADFAAGPGYGTTTLDALRAVSRTPATGIAKAAKVGLVGYSGGAIATNWAAALAPKYAPDVDRRIVGATSGGILVDPDHNLRYIEGSTIWAGVLAMALVGIGRAYDVDLRPYLSAYGLQVYNKLQKTPISDVLGRYPGLTWKQLAKPRYPTPHSVPIYVKLANRINLGSRPTPNVPLFLGQGANGELEGTPGTKSGIGRGDGVMIAGDVRALARQYCRGGATVQYRQYDATSHFTTVPAYLPEAYAWLSARFAGLPAPSSCGSIPAGNSLAPIR